MSRLLRDSKSLKFIFGMNLENRNQDGMLVYNCSPLIKMYQKIGLQVDGEVLVSVGRSFLISIFCLSPISRIFLVFYVCYALKSVLGAIGGKTIARARKPVVRNHKYKRGLKPLYSEMLDEHFS